jgi:hypothetical protein
MFGPKTNDKDSCCSAMHMCEIMIEMRAELEFDPMVESIVR